MDLSTRDIGRILGLGRDATSRVIAAGLLGDPVVRGRTHLYVRDAVMALAAWPTVDEGAPLDDACDGGVLVARVDPRVAGPVASPRRLAVGRAAVLTVLLARQRRVPMVTTVAGFVVSGADIVGVSTGDERYPLTELATAAPGRWFDAFEKHRLLTGPGDPWLFWHSRWAAPIRRDWPRSA